LHHRGADGILLDMGLPAEKPRRATCADLDAVPEHNVAEILSGMLYVFPRPSIPHSHAASRLGVKLGGPFDLGEGGPGGWHILDEPELHFGPKDEEDVLVADLAGFRVERMPRVPRTAFLTLAPDWVCEVLSASTETTDRAVKMPIYAREGVRHIWLLHPIRQTLEVFELDAEGRWILLDVHQGQKRVRARPFDAIELDLALLWPDKDDAPPEDEEASPRPPSSKPRATSKKARKRERK
jgi:Uma2 family endonuclease